MEVVYRFSPDGHHTFRDPSINEGKLSITVSDITNGSQLQFLLDELQLLIPSLTADCDKG